MKIRKSLILALTIGLFLSTFAMAEDEPSEQVKRLDASAAVLDEIMGLLTRGSRKKFSAPPNAWL